MSEQIGWFADLGEHALPGTDQWQPFLQIPAGCFPLPIWFDTEAACLEFIAENIAGRGLLP